MDHVMPPRFVSGPAEVAETLDELSRDCEAGRELQGVACVVVIDGEVWRYSCAPDTETAELMQAEIEELAGDVEAETR